MPARSQIELLPPEIRQEFEKELIKRSFSNYSQLIAWLSERGYQISRSAAHRFGQNFQARCDAIRIATEQARAIVASVGDDEDNLSEALIRLIQQMTFDILIKQGEDIGEILPKIGIMVSKLSKASVDVKKNAAEIRNKTKNAADDVVKIAKSKGLTDATAEQIRKKILGIGQ